MREIKCPSGAILKVTPAPFAVAKALYQAVLKEGRTINVHIGEGLPNLYKEIFCAGFSDPAIDLYLKQCLLRCLYCPAVEGGAEMKIEDSTFEPVEAREDYMFVCMEVAKENLTPFVKSLYAEYRRILEMSEDTQK